MFRQLKYLFFKITLCSSQKLGTGRLISSMLRSIKQTPYAQSQKILYWTRRLAMYNMKQHFRLSSTDHLHPKNTSRNNLLTLYTEKMLNLDSISCCNQEPIVDCCSRSAITIIGWNNLVFCSNELFYRVEYLALIAFYPLC